jgi:hypothetical protein
LSRFPDAFSDEIHNGCIGFFLFTEIGRCAAKNQVVKKYSSPYMHIFAHNSETISQPVYSIRFEMDSELHA